MNNLKLASGDEEEAQLLGSADANEASVLLQKETPAGDGEPMRRLSADRGRGQ